MQRALWVSMNPIPPMSAARLYTRPAPATARLQASRPDRSRTMFSASGDT